MNRQPAPLGLPTHRFPVDAWRLVERAYSNDDLGVTETLFALGNGYLGMRANPEEGREAHSHGTYLNGFHETWPILHAEEAFGFAKTGQTIVNVPDAKLLKLYVDDEPLLLPIADLEGYERALDFRNGVLTREMIWRTPAGKRVRVSSQRMVSFVHRHLAVMTFEITLLDAAAPVVVSSQLLNRQDGEDEYHVKAAALGEGLDPRRSRKFDHRVLEPRLQREDGNEIVLGYRCANSKMTLACGTRHHIETTCQFGVTTHVGADLAKTVFTVRATPGNPIKITKLVSYHSSNGVPAEELADRCSRTLERAEADGIEQIVAEQREWLDEFWVNSDIELRGDDAAQQALRWNLFQLAQASARTQEQGIAAKGVTGGGYDGHYFWDTEVYVAPFLSYTMPEAARKVIRFRWQMLDAARQRAREMSQVGALYPWRTISGEEASAYYAAGTAQYHINAAVVLALRRYLEASGDIDFLSHEGAEILVETARLWADLGFYSQNGSRTFHIHRVTGPDEYTTVVNDNFYTNVMARFNLRYAARTIRFLAEWNADAFDALCRATDFELQELDDWDAAADAMFIPFDEELGINPQDSEFLELEPWDWETTPPEDFPLLLNYHPLVIYRHQVLKQADVVLAMFLRSERFPIEQKRRNFDFYDPITTGDSSLSACVQAVVAAEVGYEELALTYFTRALYLDLCDSHGNTADGVHVANAGGVWAGIVNGFAGMVEQGNYVEFTPRLPSTWDSVSFRLQRHGSILRVELDPRGVTLTVLSGSGVPVRIDDDVTLVTADAPLRIDR
ncbi:MAG TPA: glycosyl hydrolase family 65 protein [Ilumatobacteraceae bacterium]|nr:glycosyl hydrolase family 65 protein [Ilumatobacteraceae bacterium]